MNIKNIATVNQTNYDPNNTNDQSDITINVGKDSNPGKDNSGTNDTSNNDSGNDANTVKVNAKTTSMKNTGVPLGLLVLAILAVFSGMFSRRK